MIGGINYPQQPGWGVICTSRGDPLYREGKPGTDPQIYILLTEKKANSHQSISNLDCRFILNIPMRKHNIKHYIVISCI